MSAAVSLPPSPPDVEVLPPMIFAQLVGRPRAQRRLVWAAFNHRAAIAALDAEMLIPMIVYRPDAELLAALSSSGCRDELRTHAFGLADTAPGFDMIRELHDRLADAQANVVPVLAFSRLLPKGVLVRIPRVIQ